MSSAQFRSRDKSWGFCRIALEFFAKEKSPLGKMTNADEFVGKDKQDNSGYCLAQPGQFNPFCLPTGGTVSLDLAGTSGAFAVARFNPREGGALKPGAKVRGGAKAAHTAPSTDDWLPQCGGECGSRVRRIEA